MSDLLRTLVLGAAAGGGLPQWNCGCANCNRARLWKGPTHDASLGDDIRYLGDDAEALTAIAPQSQSSLAVSANGSDWAILNASPDIRTQIQDNPPLHPTGLRESPIKSILLTNGDIDHIAGLLILREKQPFTVFLTHEIAKVIAENKIFSALDRDLVQFREIELNQSFTLVNGVEAELFAVPGKVPLFMEEGEVITDLVGEQTVGVRLSHDKACVWYIPGCAKLTDDLKARLRGEKLVFFDGTVFDNDEMQQNRVGAKTGARMGHMAMNGAKGSVAEFASLDVERKIFIHINNTNPVWDRTSKARQKVEAAGWEIAFDGMEVCL